MDKIGIIAFMLSIVALIFSLSGVILPTSSVVAGDWQVGVFNNTTPFVVPSGKTYECYIYMGSWNATSFTGHVADLEGRMFCKPSGISLLSNEGLWVPCYVDTIENWDLSIVSNSLVTAPHGWILTSGEGLKPFTPFGQILVRWRDLTA